MSTLIRLALLLWLVVIVTFTGGAVMAYEVPPYDVVHQADGYEVRKYDDRLAAQVAKNTSPNRAFGLLFGYISGDNQKAEKC